jgi:tetratricopeptide (TPR) repeat protein
MNRTERRAARKRRGRVTPGGSSSPENPADIDYRLAAAKRLQQTGELIAARDICRDILAHHPRHVQTLIVLAGILQQGGRNTQAVKVLREAMALGGESATSHDILAMAYQGLGRRKDAILHFKQAISAGLGDVETLIKESPTVAGCLQRLNERWPRRMPLQELFGGAGIAAVASDALLVALLHMRPVCDIELERLLTATRHAWLQTALTGDTQSKTDEGIEFYCALAQQCFINEYVYALSDGEIEQARILRDRLVQALQSGADVEPDVLIVVAAYFPLYALPGAKSLMNRSWSDAISSLVRQQVREPLDEIDDRKSIAALTAVTNAVSLQVKQQYEENPYPRWTFAKVPTATTIGDYLRSKLPYAQVHHSRMPNDFDVLIAGCGTGAHSIQTAQRFPQARVLAIDISLPSLAYPDERAAMPVCTESSMRRPIS